MYLFLIKICFSCVLGFILAWGFNPSCDVTVRGVNHTAVTFDRVWDVSVLFSIEFQRYCKAHQHNLVTTICSLVWSSLILAGDDKDPGWSVLARFDVHELPLSGTVKQNIMFHSPFLSFSVLLENNFRTKCTRNQSKAKDCLWHHIFIILS